MLWTFVEISQTVENLTWTKSRYNQAGQKFGVIKTSRAFIFLARAMMAPYIVYCWRSGGGGSSDDAADR